MRSSIKSKGIETAKEENKLGLISCGCKYPLVKVVLEQLLEYGKVNGDNCILGWLSLLAMGVRVQDSEESYSWDGGVST